MMFISADLRVPCTLNVNMFLWRRIYDAPIQQTLQKELLRFNPQSHIRELTSIP